MLLLYDDDLFLTGGEELIKDVRRRLAIGFKMKELGVMHYFLGMVWQSVDQIFCGQGNYAVETMKRFGMLYCKEIDTPMESNLKLLSDSSYEIADAMMYRQMIVSLMFLMNTRPDICFVVNNLSQFLADPRHVHLVAAKHVLRYLKGIVEYGFKYDVN